MDEYIKIMNYKTILQFDQCMQWSASKVQDNYFVCGKCQISYRNANSYFKKPLMSLFLRKSR